MIDELPTGRVPGRARRGRDAHHRRRRAAREGERPHRDRRAEPAGPRRGRRGASRRHGRARQRRAPLRGAVTTHGDHRIAMAFGVLGASDGGRSRDRRPRVRGRVVPRVLGPAGWGGVRMSSGRLDWWSPSTARRPRASRPPPGGWPSDSASGTWIRERSTARSRSPRWRPTRPPEAWSETDGADRTPRGSPSSRPVAVRSCRSSTASRSATRSARRGDARGVVWWLRCRAFGLG